MNISHPIKSLRDENEKLRMDIIFWQVMCILLCFSLMIVGVVTGIYIGTEGVVSTSNYNSCIR